MRREKSVEFESAEDWRNFQKYIRDESRYVLTPKWESFLCALIKTSHRREFTLRKKECVTRARIGAVGKYPAHIQPLPPEEMIGPPREIAVEGRLNPSGIPYLYLANNKETAIAEVRPWVGACVTVAYFSVKQDQRLIDLTKDFHRKKKQSSAGGARPKEEIIWSDMNQSFSEPISPDDIVSQYVHTQYITEIFKRQGYDGVRYKSSLHENGYNYLLFNTDVVRFLKSLAVRVGGVAYRFKVLGKPVTFRTPGKSE